MQAVDSQSRRRPQWLNMVPNKPLRTIEVLEITEEEAVGREEDLLALAQLAALREGTIAIAGYKPAINIF
uniref:Uncharacterized protein n=1 Tax=Oryza meridionalis TaxID=40149 RepID=A0A0E0C4C4_9ORYZ